MFERNNLEKCTHAKCGFLYHNNLPSSPYILDFSAISIAGSSRDQYDAASITPPAKPKLASNSFRWKIKT